MIRCDRTDWLVAHEMVIVYFLAYQKKNCVFFSPGANQAPTLLEVSVFPTHRKHDKKKKTYRTRVGTSVGTRQELDMQFLKKFETKYVLF